ncbi:MAG TPA: alpha/beta hydrolase [Candidatus Macondimonas sp.]|nr:alpha/beta hydrolase [Candidatus Macondimonas sp.]
MTEIATADAQSGPVRLTYRVFNAGAGGRPLLMIMGLSGVKEDWQDLPEALAADRPVAVFDNRGMGESEVPDGPYTMDQMAGDAEAILDTLAWPQAHVMGISMGGMIAQTLALRAPERIDRLVLGCTSDSGRFAPAPDRAVMNAMMPIAGTTPQEAAARALAVNYTPEWIAQDPDRFQALVDQATRYRRRAKGMLAQAQAIARFHAAEALARLTQPALVIHGTADQLIPFPNGERLSGRLPGARFAALPDCGHLFWHMAPTRSQTLIRGFLAEAA